METKRRTLAHVLVCSGCCCGRTDRGRPEVPVDWLKREWKGRRLLKQVHLSISGCLGPCDLPNVVCVVTPAGIAYLGGFTATAQYQLLLEWAESCSDAGQLRPLPAELAALRLERFRPEADPGGVAAGPA